MKKIIIAIDGFSSCGKSTMAKDLAREIGYIYVDTGAMYRAVALYALRNGLFDHTGEPNANAIETHLKDINIAFQLNPSTNRPETLLNGENVETEIRSLEVSQHVSQVAKLPAVRSHLVALQQAMGRDKGIVMDGRDIGTVVFPDAELKIFVTATAEVRAKRRFDELAAKGEKADFDEILRNVEQRDHIDTHREVSPLVKACDAIELDNSSMSIAEQKQWLLDRYCNAIKNLSD